MVSYGGCRDEAVNNLNDEFNVLRKEEPMEAEYAC